MPSENYSFLDVAVLDAVRQRFAAGDAIAVLSADLEQVIWANGPGAAVFGYPDIEAIIGASTGLPLIARRQIMATSGFPQIGRERAITVRLATGLTSRAVGFLASAVTMPDGENAIMLAVPAAQTGSRSAAEIAARAISGFTEDGHYIAFVDAKGNIEAASDGFSALGILPETLAALVVDVAHESDRIVKRLVPGGTTSYPAGLARLTDERHLLVVIDEDQLDSEEASAGRRSAGMETATGAAAAVAAVRPKAEQDNAPAVAKTDAAAQTISAAGEDTSVSAEHEIADSIGPDSTVSDSTAPDSTEQGPEAAGGMPPQHDHWYFSASEDEAQKPGPDASGHVEADASAESSAQDAIRAASPTERAIPSIDRAAPPLRFVWRTDAEGRFSALSPEFAELVGKPAADVIGRRFRDVAATFDLDASGEIAGLLDRRDTWSGRSVLWPVAGTDFKIPVDLAALPVYGRSRAFEGFRGFGVARTSDAVVDPEAIGMALVPNAEATAAVETEVAETPDESDPFQGEVPALTIVPKPERRFADKVIRLAEHRQPANDKGLSTLERSAFREIGERLKKDNPPTEQPDAAKPAATEPTETDAEDEKDVARLDGEQPQATVSGISGSLLDYADRDYVADDSDGAPVSEPDKPAQEIGQPTDAANRSVADDDSMTAADFRDAEDSEDWARPDVDETGSSADHLGDAGDVEPAPVEPPRLQAPPLKLEGFVPSAFSTADDSKAPDTSILGKLPVPLLIHSGDDLHYANEEFLRLTGYDTLDDLEDAGGLGALFADPYDNSASDGTDHALRLKTHDGQEFPIEAILRSVPWRGGKALMLVVRRSGDDEAAAIPHGAADDQTQPDTSELKARIAEMRTIIDTATDGVVLIGRDGTIRSISRPAEALFGFDSDEVTGKPFVSLFAIESQRAARDYLDGLSEPGVASVLNDGREVIGREAQGRFIPLFMTIGSLPNDSGFCAVVRDITQWKRAEEDLTQARAVAERASSQKTDFLARISHEIRTPLNAIIGFSELMVDEKFGPVANDRYRDYLRDINRSGNHVLDLVNDLLDISKIEAGQQEMAYEAVSLNDTLAETVAMMQPQANRERVIIRSSFASRLPEVVADLRSVRQIALNILSNAIRYTQAGGQVIVSTAYEISGDVVMRVRDTGIGMSQSEIEQALKPFKQINALKRGRGDGTGLGLPLTKAMVEANRARFTINSTPGEGTLVEVAFPSTRVLAD
ncbi:MAG: PAS domain S-box protein [Mesorhizobium sp.]|uniref:PAS domain S-box protein n=1 Tax=Mesorhizobium sp. TaxID=1871066 RepID=UPI000FE523B0|nr:PAS domain S-box protein [Mesorhizobium sp.]RWH74202.1 MAG: PAS domain S-box protein [Mesorhizobium sp.]RWH78163.1 MAG: PAS domain S-box protein [Mesorhizobium sp.]RWH86265.1 MAG: PAS domain S-box protein [Mesorhizobium sp.]RWH96353.1 MAG: PAS domain S-box protein [Mesorhizobium sp.]RWH96554.1 MAG: PAS domain S-box protein [Mesorhizobium sp.]